MCSSGLGYNIMVFWGMCVVVRVCEMVRVLVRWLGWMRWMTSFGHMKWLGYNSATWLGG